MERLSLRPVVPEDSFSTARQQNTELQPLSDGLNLMECGLHSLGLAMLVARPEDDLGMDPLSGDHDAIPFTLGDFIRRYECPARHAATHG